MRIKNYITLLAIGLIWGSQFAFQEQALSHFSPIWIGTFRAILGAITLSIICKIAGIRSLNRHWTLFALIGLLEATIPFVLVPWGQKNLTSSTTAILMGTLPFYTLLLAPVFIKGAKISVANIASVLLGFCGLLLLFSPEWSSNIEAINLASALAILIAAVCFAMALLMLNRLQHEHPLIVARNVLSMASIQLIILALLTTPVNIKQVSLPSALSLLYLGVICAGVVYYLYMISIKNAGVVFTSMTNYLVPAVGVLIGVLISDEPMQATSWMALTTILFALFINQLSSNNTN